jgi:hypothetical protein
MSTGLADIRSFIEAARQAPAAKSSDGRLIFALDATASRAPTWELASTLQAEMFREAVGLELQLAYYRGPRECRTSPWTKEPAKLMSWMQKIKCESGATQIERILDHAAKGKAPLVFIGDAMEENSDILVGKASKLSAPAFMFQEGDDPLVEHAFRDIARASGGVHARFNSGSAKQLGELLKAVAAYAAGGVTALKGRKDEASRLLIAQMKG